MCSWKEEFTPKDPSPGWQDLLNGSVKPDQQKRGRQWREQWFEAKEGEDAAQGMTKKTRRKSRWGEKPVLQSLGNGQVSVREDL